MSQHRLLIDASSIVRAAHYAGRDIEYGYQVTFEEKKVWINSAGWGFENFMVGLRSLLNLTRIAPFNIVLVKDGMNSRSLRASIFPGYKAHRAATAPELGTEYRAAMEMVENEIMALGGMVVVQDGIEADDVIAHLSLNLEGRTTIWSRDKDMLALHSPSCDVYLKDELNPEIVYGCPASYVDVYKALVGDPSDGFPGAKGFGAKSFTDLVMTFGFDGLDMLRELIIKRKLDDLVEDVPEFKPLQKIVDAKAEVYLSYACAIFYTHKVNTSRDPLQVRMRIAQASHPLFVRESQTKWLAKPADAARIIRELEKSPLVALDIETSTPAESDKWVAAILDSKKGGGKKTMVDVFGSKLTGMSLTFGKNMQHTIYMPVDHLECENWTSDEVFDIVAAIPEGIKVLVHNTAFELPVLYNEWGTWVAGMWDTLLMKSYVDENTSLGLKYCSEHYFGYQQTTYEEVTQGRKMNQLTGSEVLNYAADDSLCTAALHNRLLFTMELEKTVGVFEEVELPTQYWVAEAFVRGVDVDWEGLVKLEADDDVLYDRAWGIVREYLFKVNWKGTQYVPFERTPAGIKQAFTLVTGGGLDTRVRMEEKLFAALRDQGAEDLAEVLESDGDVDEYLQQFFVGEPDFDSNKSADLQALMFETMGLPIRFRTRVTDLQREKGKREGTPQADFDSVQHALKLDLDTDSEEHACLSAVREMKAVMTRKSLYYRPYPLYRHWKDGKLHPQAGQCRTTTRRFASSAVNLSQIPKRKDGGKIRSMFKAPPGYIWASFDFASQELKLQAFVSQDEQMLSCYVGDDLKDIHSLTGFGIAQRSGIAELSTYEEFVEAIHSKDPVAKALRDKGKAVNFATSYLVQAKKLGKMLVVDAEEAQKFLEAKNELYSGLAQWQQDTIREAHAQGFVCELMGGRRHLHSKLTDPQKFVVLESERQAVNAVIQASGATMAKMAVNEMQRRRSTTELGALFQFLVHDESDILVPIENAVECLMELHECMVQPYANMTIPLTSDMSIGDSFGNLHSIGTEPTPEKIKEVLMEVIKNASV